MDRGITASGAPGGASRHAARERGMSLSALVASVMVALFMVAGLVIDGGAQVQARREAEAVAAQVARVGMDASAPERALGRDGTAVALTAARASLAGRPGVEGEVRADRGRLVVTTRTSRETLFLSLLGVHRVTGDGRAAAELRPS